MRRAKVGLGGFCMILMLHKVVDKTPLQLAAGHPR
jgi:hypothetical protein